MKILYQKLCEFCIIKHGIWRKFNLIYCVLLIYNNIVLNKPAMLIITNIIT